MTHPGQAGLRSAEGGERRIDPADETVYLKRVDRVHQRYPAAIKSLVQARKVGVPAVQVNIGEKQVNVMSAGQQAGDEV